MTGPDRNGSRGSGVAGGLLGELDSGGEAELGVDVGEVGLHGAGRYEQPGGDVFVGQSFGHQPGDVALGGCQRQPPDSRPAALAAAAQGVGHGFFEGEGRAFVG